MFDKEPAVIIAVIAALIQVVFIWITENPGWVAPEWLLPAITAIVGLLTRTQVFAPQTLRDAHLNPDSVEREAKLTQQKRGA